MSVVFSVERRRMAVVSRLIELIVSVFLLVSGLIHVFQPWLFVQSVANYRLLPNLASGLIAIWLPYLSICVAACIITDCFRRAAITLALFMFAIFALAQVSVLIRGIDIECGCFGHTESNIGVTSIVQPVLLGVLLLVSARLRKRERDD